MGKFFFAICEIKGKCVISAEAILNAGTCKSYNKSALSSSKGVEKHVIPIFLNIQKFLSIGL